MHIIFVTPKTPIKCHKNISMVTLSSDKCVNCLIVLFCLVAEFEVILPVVFHSDDNEGVSLSSDLLAHLQHRQRRSLSSDLHINITTDEDHFHIELSPNTKLLAPGFKVYHHHSEYVSQYSNSSNAADNLDDITTQSDDNNTQSGDIPTRSDDISSESEVQEMSQCLFKGKVTSHGNVPAAFSLCNGLVSDICPFFLSSSFEQMEMTFLILETYLNIIQDKDKSSVFLKSFFLKLNMHFLNFK